METHGHDHAGHSHGSHGHGHDHAHGATDKTRVLIAAALTGGFMVAEALGGFLTGSLALLADAGHMLTDSISLALAWYAFHSGRAATARLTYGFDRVKTLVAYTNGLAIFAIALWIVYEACQRFLEPGAGARRADAGGGGGRAAGQHRRLLRAAWRRPQQPQHARRDPARARRHAGLGRRDRGGAGHPGDRLDADRSDPVGAGVAAHPVDRVVADARSRPCAARRRAARARPRRHRQRHRRQRRGRARGAPHACVVARRLEEHGDAACLPRPKAPTPMSRCATSRRGWRSNSASRTRRSNRNSAAAPTRKSRTSIRRQDASGRQAQRARSRW